MAKKTKQASPASWRPTNEDSKLIEALQGKTGIQSVSDIIRLGLRRLAETEGLQAA